MDLNSVTLAICNSIMTYVQSGQKDHAHVPGGRLLAACESLARLLNLQFLGGVCPECRISLLCQIAPALAHAVPDGTGRFPELAPVVSGNSLHSPAALSSIQNPNAPALRSPAQQIRS